MRRCDVAFLAELRQSPDRVVATSARAVRKAWKDICLRATSSSTEEQEEEAPPAPDDEPVAAEDFGRTATSPRDGTELARVRSALAEAKRELSREKSAAAAMSRTLRTSFNESRKAWAAEREKLKAAASRAVSFLLYKHFLFIFIFITASFSRSGSRERRRTARRGLSRRRRRKGTGL
jgi:hypothetical protein